MESNVERIRRGMRVREGFSVHENIIVYLFEYVDPDTDQRYTKKTVFVDAALAKLKMEGELVGARQTRLWNIVHEDAVRSIDKQIEKDFARGI